MVVFCTKGWESKSSLRLTFPTAKLQRQMFMTWAEVRAKNLAKNWAKYWTNLSGHFRASRAVQPNGSSTFLPKFLPTCHSMSCISKLHLRELLGLGVPKTSFPPSKACSPPSETQEKQTLVPGMSQKICWDVKCKSSSHYFVREFRCFLGRDWQTAKTRVVRAELARTGAFSFHC